MAIRTFRGTINADWNTLGNWLELAVPTAADDVVFDAASPACTFSAAGSCLTLDCTGFVATIAKGANTLTVAGTKFLLSAACWTAGTGLIDFTAAAGTLLLTSAGNTLYNLRFGNVAAGAIYQLQDNLTVTLDVDCVRGTFDTNGKTLNINRDMITELTMAVDGVHLGASTVNIVRNWINYKALVMSTATGYGTSQVNFTGTGQIGGAGFAYFNFWNIFVGAAGSVTTLNHSGSGTTGVANILTTGTGTVTSIIGEFAVSGALNNPFQPNAAVTWNAAIRFSAPTGQTIYEIPGLNYGALGIVAVKHVATTPCTHNLTGNVICASLIQFQTGTTNAEFINLNGFNLTINGNLANDSSAVLTIVIGASTLTVTGNLSYTVAATPTTNENRYFSISTGKLIVGGNLTLTSGGTRARIQITGTGEVWVGGNWNSTGTGPVFPGPGSLGTVRFTSAGPFTIAALTSEFWPTISITGGGTVSLPNYFNCYNINITAGLVTAGNPFTVRNSMTNNGTFTGSANMNIGSSFVNTGVLIMAGTNITVTGNLASISGVNPVTLTMAATCLRLQLLSSMNITTFVIQDRAVPAVVQYLAGGTYNIGTMNSQVVSTDGTVQFISSAAGTKYNWNVTAAITSIANIWPRDNDASGSAVAPVGNLTNKDLGNNTGWSLYVAAYVRLISDDPGQDLLADASIGSMQYCWFAATSQAALAALATAFGTGANNWHRKTNLPFVLLDNLNKGTVYFVALGMIDDWGRRYPPNVGAGDFTTMTALSTESSFGGGGSHNITVSPQWALQG